VTITVVEFLANVVVAVLESETSSQPRPGSQRPPSLNCISASITFVYGVVVSGSFAGSLLYNP